MNEKSIITFLFDLVSRRREDIQEARCRVKLGLGPLLRQVIPTDMEVICLERAQESLARLLQGWAPYDPHGSYKENTYWVALGQDVVSAKFVIVDEGVGSWMYDDGGDPCDEIDMTYATHIMPRAVPAPPCSTEAS